MVFVNRLELGRLAQKLLRIRNTSAFFADMSRIGDQRNERSEVSFERFF